MDSFDGSTIQVKNLKMYLMLGHLNFLIMQYLYTIRFKK